MRPGSALNGDGSIDSTFGTNGLFTFDPTGGTGDSNAYSIALQPDDKILLGGSIHTGTSQAMVVARFHNNDITGIASIQPIAAIQLYPNPAYGEVVFESSKAAFRTITIYDYCGKQVLRVKLGLSREIINIKTLQPGLYCVKVAENGVSHVLKLLVAAR